MIETTSPDASTTRNGAPLRQTAATPPSTWQRDIIEELQRRADVELETLDFTHGVPRRSRSWIVTLDDRVFVRSLAGRRRPWFRDAAALPRLTLSDDGLRFCVDARPVSDQPTLTAVTDAFLEKYGRHADVLRALHPDSVAATLELSPVA